MELQEGTEVELFLFDLDDTLIDTKRSMHQAKSQFRTLNGFSDEDMRQFDRIFHPFSSRDERIQLWKDYLETHTKHQLTPETCYSRFEDLRLKGLCPIPGARKVLETLHDNGTKYGILTNGHPSIQEPKVINSGILEWNCCKNIPIFYGYEGESSVPKPNPKIFHTACDHFKIPTGSTVMVGDTLGTDIVGANNANLGFAIYFQYDKHSKDSPRLDGLSTKVLQAYSHDHMLDVVHSLLQRKR